MSNNSNITCQQQCGECGRIITGKLQFRLHSEKHVRDKAKREKGAYKCEVCGRGFVTATHLKQHDDMKHKNIGGCKCTVCTRVFSSEHNLRQHIATHANMGAFRCSMCTRTFSSDHNRRQHQATHSAHSSAVEPMEKAEGEMFPCKLCDRLFGNDFNRKQHEFTHQRKNKRHGHSSGKELVVPHVNLNNGEDKNGTDGPYKCNYCAQVFASMNDKLQHEEIHKKLTHDGSVQNADGARTQESCAYVGAMNSVAPGDEEKPVVCSLCGLLFNSIEHLAQHTKEHEALSKIYPGSLTHNAAKEHVANKAHQVPLNHHSKDHDALKLYQSQNPLNQLMKEQEALNKLYQSQNIHAKEQEVMSKIFHSQKDEEAMKMYQQNSLSQISKEQDALNKLFQAQSSTVQGQQQQQRSTTPGQSSSCQANSARNTPIDATGRFSSPPTSNASMLEELSSAMMGWNSYYAGTGKMDPAINAAYALASQSQLMSNHTAAAAAAETPPAGAGTGANQPKKKKKKKRSKSNVSLDEIYECDICKQQFATDFHRNIHANSHKSYADGTKIQNVSIEEEPDKSTPPVEHCPPSSLPSTTSVSINDSIATSSSHSMHAAAAAMHNSGFQAASLPTMSSIAAANQYAVSMGMPPGTAHPMFPLLHRPQSGTFNPAMHHIPQQPLFPQPIAKTVFPQR